MPIALSLASKSRDGSTLPIEFRRIEFRRVASAGAVIELRRVIEFRRFITTFMSEASGVEADRFGSGLGLLHA